MKPLKLTMQSFGSYGRKTEIDFESPNQNLFLITGDTGAGKTTIFDAIVFALYGEASSGTNKKEGTVLQSQYTDYDSEPYVELTFSDGNAGAVYTVKRVPSHIRIKKRGSGIKKETGSISLIMPDHTEYPSKEANQKLIDIVGLTKDQFMQVAMIAQGEFMEMLRAKSDDKKEIFRKLFNTGMYQKITEELANRKRKKEKELAAMKTEWITVARSVLIPSKYETYEELTALKKQLTDGDVSQTEAFLSQLEKLCTELKIACDNAKKQYDSADRQRDEANTAFTDAKNLLQHFKHLEDAQKVITKYHEKEEAIQKTIVLIGKIRSAYEIKPPYEMYVDAENAVKKDENELSEKQRKMPVLLEEATKTEQEEQTANDNYHHSLEHCNKISEKVSKALESFEKIKEAKIRTEQKERLWQQEERKLSDKQKELEVLETEEAEKRIQAEKLSDLPKRLAEWETKKNRLDESENEVHNLLLLEKDLNTLDDKLHRLNDRFSAEQESYRKKNADYENMEHLFLNNQLGIIAKQLVTGQPCPVCGSTEHPSPYISEDFHHNITEEKLNTARTEVEKLREKKEKSFSELSSFGAALTEKKKNFDEKYRKLKNDLSESDDEITVQELQKVISDKQNRIAAEGQILNDQKKTLEQINTFLQNVNAKKNGLRTEIDMLHKNVQNALEALAGSKAELNSLSSSSDYETEEDAKAALQQAETDRKQKKQLWQRAEKSANSAKSKKERTEEDIDRLTADLPQKREKANALKQKYEILLKEKCLSETEWRDITAQHPISEADKYQNTVNDYEKNKAKAESVIEMSQEAIGGREKPVIADFEKAVEDANRLRTIAEKTYQEYHTHYETDNNAYQILSPKLDERKKTVAEHSTLDNLYKILSGNVSGSRMDLETFVQRYYLERILHAANRRFREMSAGQFELCMYDIDKAGEGKNRGLDLMVYSTVTGKKREVRTLSGGESFMAALSLALGLADQIQESSAALSLDVMFIDEGFGSLDDNSRNQAVKVLRQMAEGSRLIGIISHVTELKQEIDNQLIVTKTDHGSQAKWQN